MEDKYIEIVDYELARLYSLDGKVDAVQSYVSRTEFLDVDVILSILGICMEMHDKLVEKKND